MNVGRKSIPNRRTRQKVQTCLNDVLEYIVGSKMMKLKEQIHYMGCASK